MTNSKAVHDFTDFSNGNANGWRDTNGGGTIESPHYTAVFTTAGFPGGITALATIDKRFPVAFKQTKMHVKFRIRFPLGFKLETLRLYAAPSGGMVFDHPPIDNNWHVVQGEWTPTRDDVTGLTFFVEGPEQGVGQRVGFDDIEIVQD
ncbi:hypothetical protein [Pseudomonas hamedanensis]|uniref:Uncharacterized protein n=1 Tax=Pseudomonas hamedanensis TaxID=2745504 RepID=A0A9E6THZ9_9PSED|nr:hypothetical protein [Pseudomonas hamedanensis]QXI18349.1 hypothetical protein HU739_004975 [Pseudomonas hamedanensis]